MKLSFLSSARCAQVLWLFLLVGIVGFAWHLSSLPSRMNDINDNEEYQYIYGKIEQEPNTKEERTYEIRAYSWDEKGNRIQVTTDKKDSNDYSIGDTVQIYKTINDGKAEYEIVDFYHTGGMQVILLLFVLVSIIVAGKKWITSVLSTFLSLGLFYFLFLRMIQTGYNPLVACLVFVTVITLLTLPLIHGYNKKSLSALVALFISFGVSLLITFTFAWIVQIGNTPEENFRVLWINYSFLDIRSIMFASVFIGSVGALIDTALSISSALFETMETGIRSFRELYNTGMAIGKDIIGSMTNTLLFAYMGANLPLFLLLSVGKQHSMTEFLNYDFIALEMTKTFVGAVSLILLVPLTAALCASALGKKG